ncbi:MAG: class I SAM-dependent methyltransferase [Phycisphaerae bacterium]
MPRDSNNSDRSITADASPRCLPVVDARIPQWDPAALAPRDCPFCRSPGVERFIRPDQLHVRECDVCGTYFVSPAPTEETLIDFYARYHTAHGRAGNVRPESLRHDVQLSAAGDVRVATLASCMPLEGRRALDVGCGMGLQMAHLRAAGLVVTGIDLDPDSLQIAREHLGFSDLHQCDIQAFEAAEPFDVVTLNDLIEHPLDPLGTLAKARDLLRPGGLISIWTPNASFAAQDREPVLFSVDLEHMQYLSVRTCLWLLDRLGLTLMHLEAIGFPDLRDMDRSSADGAAPSSMRNRIKAALKTMPGFATLNRARHALRPAAPDPRRGRYHLFCVFRTPEHVRES